MLLKFPDAYPVIHNILHDSIFGPCGLVRADWDTEAMWLAQFMFTPGEYDDEFHRLNDAIDAFAESLEGFVGAERWLSPDGKTQNSMYYWRDRQSLGEFSRFPEHLVAKKNYQRWYHSYQAVISEVSASYGDSSVPHLSQQTSPQHD